MKLINYVDVPANGLLIPGAKDVTVRLLVGPGDDNPHSVMLFLEIAPGGHTPDHGHAWEEQIFVKAGEGQIKTQAGIAALQAGCVLRFGPDESHQFINRGTAPLELLCIIPRRS